MLSKHLLLRHSPFSQDYEQRETFVLINDVISLILTATTSQLFTKNSSDWRRKSEWIQHSVGIVNNNRL